MMSSYSNRLYIFFFYNDTSPAEIYTLSLHDALPIWYGIPALAGAGFPGRRNPGLQTGRAKFSRHPPVHAARNARSEEHTSELQSLAYLVCRLLLEKKKTTISTTHTINITRSPYHTQN